MKQVEIQKRLRFRITKNGFLLDEQEGEFSEKILPWRKSSKRTNGRRYMESEPGLMKIHFFSWNCVESMLENADAPSERIINDDHWEKLFGVL